MQTKEIQYSNLGKTTERPDPSFAQNFLYFTLKGTRKGPKLTEKMIHNFKKLKAQAILANRAELVGEMIFGC